MRSSGCIGVLAFIGLVIGASCFACEGLILALAAASHPPSPSLLVYQPTPREREFLPTTAEAALTEPELMLSLTGQAKSPVQQFRWYGEYPITLFGRPYQVGGTWYVDFDSVAVMPPGTRLLWRMPVADFVRGTGADLPARLGE